MADGELTTLVLVARAEASALREAARAGSELAALGVHNQRLIINGVLLDAGHDPTAVAFAGRQAAALAGAADALSEFDVAGVELVTGDVTGRAALRQLAGFHVGPAALELEPVDVELPGLGDLVDALDAGGNGVVMTMGKGGVGKTTLAAALALALADRGHEVTLSTTDPAAHIVDALGDAVADNLRVERIDPAVETARYTEEVLAAATGLDGEGRALLLEDLRSPCTEEIAVFRAFARTVDQARERIVVLDTAPTGHTLLLLDAAQSYQREVQRTNADVPAEVSQLLLRACETRSSLACCWSRSPSPRQCTRLTACRQTCAARASSHSAGSSTPRWPRAGRRTRRCGRALPPSSTTSTASRNCPHTPPGWSAGSRTPRWAPRRCATSRRGRRSRRRAVADEPQRMATRQGPASR